MDRSTALAVVRCSPRRLGVAHRDPALADAARPRPPASAGHRRVAVFCGVRCARGSGHDGRAGRRRVRGHGRGAVVDASHAVARPARRARSDRHYPCQAVGSSRARGTRARNGGAARPQGGLGAGQRGTRSRSRSRVRRLAGCSARRRAPRRFSAPGTTTSGSHEEPPPAGRCSHPPAGSAPALGCSCSTALPTGSPASPAAAPESRLRSEPESRSSGRSSGRIAGGDGLGYPFDGSVLAVVTWLLLRSALVAAPFFGESDPVPRRTYVALLVWLAPIALVWASAATRRGPPARTGLACARAAAAAALTTASLALLRRCARLRRRSDGGGRGVASPTSCRSTGWDVRAGARCSTSARPAGTTRRRWRTSPTGRSRIT